MARFDGRTAVVTGSGRGIGRAVALLLAQEGAKVVVNDPGVSLDGSGTDNGPAAQVVEEIRAAGGTAVPNFDSIATVEGGENLIKTALDNWGRLDIVVNVAGILRDRMIFNMSPEEWQAVLDVHLKGHFNTIKPASILMRQQRGGRIINFTSTTGLVGNAGQANYGAAKAGISGLTRVIAKDLGRYGVTCNAIAPGANTRMTASVSDQSRALRAGVSGGGGAAGGEIQDIRRPIMPELRDAEYVAPMTVWLCTDAAWDINGKIFHVAGGNVSLASEESAGKTIAKAGMWSVDELATFVPSILMNGVPNPAPPAPDLNLPGRPVAPSA
jgi:NAD(P)-dependent dehydrogenase (short-subunit alcohol dehydrogenase family)